MLEKEFEYFKTHQNELVKKYQGKVVVIKGEDVIGAYDSYEIAFKESIKNHEMGTFLIQECEPGNEVFTLVFNSGVVFAES